MRHILAREDKLALFMDALFMELVSDLSIAKLVGLFLKIWKRVYLNTKKIGPLEFYRCITSLTSRTFHLLSVETAVE